MPRLNQIAKDFAARPDSTTTPSSSAGNAPSVSPLSNNQVKAAKTVATSTHSPALSDGSLTPSSARKIRLKISGSEAHVNGKPPSTTASSKAAAPESPDETDRGSEAAGSTVKRSEPTECVEDSESNSGERIARAVRSRRRKKLDEI
jgi:hypothetical protein